MSNSILYTGEGETLVGLCPLTQKLFSCGVLIDQVSSLFRAHMAYGAGGALAHQGVTAGFMPEMEDQGDIGQ